MQLERQLIRTDGGTQSRERIDFQVVEDYAAAMCEDVKFPPVTVFFDGEHYWLADGFHRYHASGQVGRDKIDANIQNGTQRDAVLYSVGANASHGLRRTNIDKRRAVETLLRDDEWGTRSNNWIAEQCGVSLDLVNRMRKTIQLNESLSARTFTRNGKTHSMNTANIGRREFVYDKREYEERKSAALPALPPDTPESVRDRVEAGEIPRIRAVTLMGEFRDAPELVRDVVLQTGIDEPEIIPRLTHAYKNKLSTWDTIVTTGTLDGERPIAKVSPTEFDGYLERASYEHRKAAIEERRRRLIDEAKAATLNPAAKYRVVYADPPWAYGNTMPDYFTEQADHYPLMDISEICALPVNDMVEDNAVLFLWATSPILPEALDVIRAWGFTYKASFVWDKVKHNMGHYNSVRHEFLLIAVRGSCQPDVQKLHDSVVSEERTEHSRKPETFRQIIDEIYPYGKRIELFARKQVEGWESYGNEIG